MLLQGILFFDFAQAMSEPPPPLEHQEVGGGVRSYSIPYKQGWGNVGWPIASTGLKMYYPKENSVLDLPGQSASGVLHTRTHTSTHMQARIRPRLIYWSQLLVVVFLLLPALGPLQKDGLEIKQTNK